MARLVPLRFRSGVAHTERALLSAVSTSRAGANGNVTDPDLSSIFRKRSSRFATADAKQAPTRRRA